MKTRSQTLGEGGEELEKIGVLYNTCYGGFGFSDEFEAEFQRIHGRECDMQSYGWFNNGKDKRHHPDYVQLFRRLGSQKSSGECAEISLKWIPKEMEDYYTIIEYDGTERVSLNYNEVHRDLLKQYMEEQINRDELTEKYNRLLFLQEVCPF